MKRNIILGILIITLCVLITCVTVLVIDNDLLYSLWCVASVVIGFFAIDKLKDWADYLSELL